MQFSMEGNLFDELTYLNEERDSFSINPVDLSDFPVKFEVKTENNDLPTLPDPYSWQSDGRSATSQTFLYGNHTPVPLAFYGAFSFRWFVSGISSRFSFQ